MLLAVMLVAWLVRVQVALPGTLHPDEALYAYWGRLIASGRDPWLSSVPVYKPPLLPYIAAGSRLALGGPETTVRFLGLAAGLLTVALSAALARALYRDRWLAGPAAVVVALSPYGTLFSATLFPDPLMTVLGLGACVAATRRRASAAGLLAGLAFAAKQTGLVWAPLALVLLFARERALLRPLARYLAGMAAPMGVVFGWDGARSVQGARGFWDVGVRGYGGLRVIWPHELVPRTAAWARLASDIGASPVLNGLMTGGLLLLTWSAFTRGRLTAVGLGDISLVGFGAVLLMLHWLLAFPAWDRYLLPLVPVYGVLAARIAREVQRRAFALADKLRSRAGRRRGHRHRRTRCAASQVAAQLALAATLVGPATRALAGELPIGGDRGASQGIEKVALWLADLPEGSVVYHHWQGWHYRYFLFDAPVFLAYWPHPAWLAEDVQAFGAGDARYVAFPHHESPDRVVQTLSAVGYGLKDVLLTRSTAGEATFALHRIVPLAETSAD
jgi:4-amino-4-deoxy-L-arabinose transferase-like glycosyltransferase